MTVDERFEQLERKTQRLEKRNKRLTVVLTMTVVAMAAVVTMAATKDVQLGDKDGHFDTVWADMVVARHIWVANDAGKIVVNLEADSRGNGGVVTKLANGESQVTRGSELNGGFVLTKSEKGKMQVLLRSTHDGAGRVTTYGPNGGTHQLGRTNQAGRR